MENHRIGNLVNSALLAPQVVYKCERREVHISGLGLPGHFSITILPTPPWLGYICFNGSIIGELIVKITVWENIVPVSYVIGRLQGEEPVASDKVKPRGRVGNGGLEQALLSDSELASSLVEGIEQVLVCTILGGL